MNVVIDTNVLAAGLRSRLGTSRKLISLIPSEHFTPVMTIPLYMEALDVLMRPGFLPAVYTRQDIINFCRYLVSQSVRKEVYFLWRPFLRDPKDDMILEAAIASRAKYIITFNLKDFQGVSNFDIFALTPKMFLKEIGAIS